MYVTLDLEQITSALSDAEYREHFQNIGLAGLGIMGKDLLWLMRKTQFTYQINKTLNPANIEFTVNGYDLSPENISLSLEHVRNQATRWASSARNEQELRQLYDDTTTSSADLGARYVADIMGGIHTGTDTFVLNDCGYILEAIREVPKDKQTLYTDVLQQAPDAFLASNTSSIQIASLGQGLRGILTGKHYFNPASYMMGEEIIFPEGADPKAMAFAVRFAKDTGKEITFSKDVPGFITTTQIMAEIKYATELLGELVEGGMPETEALLLVDHVTREYLGRPMGIVKVSDFTGWGTIHHIANYMAEKSTWRFQNALADDLFSKGVIGGQNVNLTQKDGVFKYGPKGEIVAVYDRSQGEYVTLEAIGWAEKLKAHTEADVAALGGTLDYRGLIGRATNKEDISSVLDPYFAKLAALESRSGKIAQKFLRRSGEVGQTLIDTGVVLVPKRRTADDVYDRCMISCFRQLYGGQKYGHQMQVSK